jgi:hypothetical protein
LNGRLPLRIVSSGSGVLKLKAAHAPIAFLADAAQTVNPLAAQAQAAASQTTAISDPLGDVAAQVSGPVIQIVGKNVGGGILLAAPIVGAMIVFAIIAFIITSTFYLPDGSVEHARNDKDGN